MKAGLQNGENNAEAWRAYHRGDELTSAQRKVVEGHQLWQNDPDSSCNNRWWANYRRLKKCAGRSKTGNTFIVSKGAGKPLRKWWLYQLGLQTNATGVVSGWKRTVLLKNLGGL